MAELPLATPPDSTVTTPTDGTRVSARDLVRLVQTATGDPGSRESQVVFEAFYERYSRYVATVVTRYLGHLVDRTGVAEVVHDVFLAFFQDSQRFDVERTADDDTCDRNLRTYLALLAKWKATDARAFQQSFGANAADSQTVEMHLQSRDAGGVPDSSKRDVSMPPSEELLRIVEWLESLPERDQDVLRAYYCDDHAGQKSDRLPEEVTRRLAEKYNITPANLRKIKAKWLAEARAKFSSPSNLHA